MHFFAQCQPGTYYEHEQANQSCHNKALLNYMFLLILVCKPICETHKDHRTISSLFFTDSTAKTCSFRALRCIS